MKRSISSNACGVGLESLEDRRLMSGDLSLVVNQARAQLSAAASAVVERIQSVVTGATSSSSTSDKGGAKTAPAPKTLDEALARLRAQAQLLGATNSALAQAIKQTGAQADVAKGYEAGLRTLIADGLALPAEALKTNLTASELLKHVGDLQVVGGQDQQSSVTYWQDVKTKGADAALAGVVVANMGIPAAAVVGKKAQEILSDAANIQLMTGDVRSPKAWQGLVLVKAGKISVEKYADNYTDASDVGQGAGGNANQNVQVKQPVSTKEIGGGNIAVDRIANGNGGTGNGTGGGTGGNATVGGNVQTTPANGTAPAPESNMPPVTNTPPAGNDSSSNANGTTGQHVGTITNVQNSSDGTSSYTLTETYPDGRTTTVEVTVHPDGSATIERQDGSTTELPAGSADPMPASAEGATIPMGQDANGDGTADQGTYTPPAEGDGDGNDDDGDGDDDDDDDDNGDAGTDTAPADDAPSGDDSAAPATGDAAQGTPTPDGDTSDPRLKADFYLNNPIGQTNAPGRDPVKASRGGGAADPEEGGENPGARNAFNSSPLGGKGSGIRVIGGAIDYPEHEQQSVVVDARQLEAIRIRSGGAVGGPEAGKTPTAPKGGDTGGILPAPPIVTGGGTRSGVVPTATFSTVKITTGTLSAAVTAKVSTAAVVK